MEVFIAPIDKSLILRARGAELLILDHHVGVLKGLKQSRDFIDYFKNSALVNRSARKLFEAWLRKDGSLFRRIYETIGDMDVEVIKESESKPAKEPAKTEKTIANEKSAAAGKSAAAEKDPKPKAKTTTKAKTKTVAKKAPAKKKATKKKATKKA